jgi:hypothetical protein
MKWHVFKALEWLVESVIRVLLEVVGEIGGTNIRSSTGGLF